MSAIGSASARGPEMWSDMRAVPDGSAVRLVRGLVEQRLQRRVLQRLGGLGVVEDLAGTPRSPGAPCGSPSPCRRSCARSRGGHLGAEDEVLDRRQVGQALVALDVLEDRVEQLQRLRRRSPPCRRPTGRRSSWRRAAACRRRTARTAPRGWRRSASRSRPAGSRARPAGPAAPRAEPHRVPARHVEEQAELAGGPDPQTRAGRLHFRCRHRRPQVVRDAWRGRSSTAPCLTERR